MLGQYYPMFDITERIAFGHDFLFEICCDVVCLPVFYLSFSSRYFHWKLNLCVILLILVFMVPFYIGYFVVSNIRLCEYLAYGIGPTNLRLQIPVRTLFFLRGWCVGHYPCIFFLPLALSWLDKFCLGLNAWVITVHWKVVFHLAPHSVAFLSGFQQRWVLWCNFTGVCSFRVLSFHPSPGNLGQPVLFY